MKKLEATKQFSSTKFHNELKIVERKLKRKKHLWTSGWTLKGNCQGLWPKQFIVSQCTSASYKSRRLDQFEVWGFFALFRLRRGFPLVAGGGDVVPSCELTLHGEILSFETSPASRPSEILQPSGSVTSFSVTFSSSASSLCSYKREKLGLDLSHG